jgi:hypothetical protein
MDPNEALAFIRNRQNTPYERVQRALELDNWLFHGGFRPANINDTQLEMLTEWRVVTMHTIDAL